MRPGDAHRDRELVVEVWRCPLGIGSWRWQLRSGDVHCDQELARREEEDEKEDEEEEKTLLIKSNNI